ncbi:MAG: hypothetical protein H6Q76_2694 [Firmicutes bacterium]|nr:hypothetical protein [Bacillota bacterium]
MEIKDEYAVPFFVSHKFLLLIEPEQLRYSASHEAFFGHEMDHVVVKVIQICITQQRIVTQAPLPTAVLEAPPVALTGKIDPLRMSELVAHKIQIALTTE